MVLIPLKDDQPLRRINLPYVAWTTIGLCTVVYLWQIGLGEGQMGAILAFGAIPAVITGEAHLPPELSLIPAWLTLVTSMFLHGGWLHLGGNMLFLWMFGDNVEDSMGHVRFAVFYLLVGIVSMLVQVATDPASTIPTIGASGAVSGILGAYVMLHPRARILLVLIRFFFTLPAWLVLGAWLALQLLNVYYADGGEPNGGVAWWAHIGGFAAGMILIIPFKRKDVRLFDRGARPLPPKVAVERLQRGRGSVPNTRRPR